MLKNIVALLRFYIIERIVLGYVRRRRIGFMDVCD